MFTWRKKKQSADWHRLEKKIDRLSHSLEKIQKTQISILDQYKEAAHGDGEHSKINIENLNVDKVIVESLEYSNNFGQLGIKELTGKLNIGTSYEGKSSKKLKNKKTKQESEEREAASPIPKLTMKAKKYEEKLKNKTQSIERKMSGKAELKETSED
ncbi:hypothetical protein [Falsibacillus pallidus]|uniref:Spore germination protein GerPC n=1 Tax=Falsibacillus pallidus TaxID=493781 RepID=A0A370GHP2_9BACI|nr:hypothetical protein [Falsibacillus pallidus]RDI43171.1 hypothetical protein DFR59_104226 [Falsibacillus pallidus]